MPNPDRSPNLTCACTQQPARMRACRFYAGEMAMSALALAAAFYGMLSVNKWSFSVFLTLQGACAYPILCRTFSPAEAAAPLDTACIATHSS